METIEKAKIRIEHWISHNEHHNEDYEAFAAELEEVGKAESATYIRQMMTLTAECTECLKKALEELG